MGVSKYRYQRANQRLRQIRYQISERWCRMTVGAEIFRQDGTLGNQILTRIIDYRLRSHRVLILEITVISCKVGKRVCEALGVCSRYRIHDQE